MSGINQIQMSFVPGEDRILLRMNTTDASGFQFWLTRRYVKLLWPVLLNMMIRDEQVAMQTSDNARQQVLSFQHEEAAQQMDYSQDYREPTEQQPLGNEPVLLAKIGVNDREDGTQVLSLHPEEGQGVELVLNQTLLHSISKLLQDTVKATEWDIDLGQDLQPGSLATNAEPRIIN